MVRATLLEQAQQLDDSEKLEMIHALWDSINHEERVASSTTLSLVKKRAAAADADPDDEISSDEFWSGIQRRQT